jgi:hypothetical protein
MLRHTVSKKPEISFQTAVPFISDCILEWASSYTLIDIDPIRVVSEMASVGITLVC